MGLFRAFTFNPWTAILCCMNSFWVAVRTQPRREHYAAENVARQGAQYYLPVFRPSCTGNKRKIAKPQVLFPRYLFVFIEGQWYWLTGTYGVSNLVYMGKDPARVPEVLITELKAAEDKEGCIGLPSELTEEFSPGQSVRVTSGPFMGHIGIYEGMTSQERECVLLSILGRKTRITITKDGLEAA